MANLGFNIRWSSNTDELRRNLREGLDQIETTKSAMDKLVRSIGGENVIRAAHNYAAALQKIGGEAGALATVEKLTSAERAKGIALLEKAIDKYKLLGKAAPAALHELLAAQKQVSASAGDLPKAIEQSGTGITSMLGSLRGLAGAIGIGFGVSQVVNFGKALFDDADALVKMRDKTGISVQWLQRLQVAGDDAGNTLEQLTGAVNKMQDRLAGGDKSAAAALQKIGLSFDQLKGLRPEDQFIRIADAIRQIEDPAQQVNVAIDLFGKAGAEILPTIKRGFDDVKNAAVGMSDETAEALDRVGDAWDAMVRRIKGTAATAIAGALDSLQGKGGSALTPGGSDQPLGFLSDAERLSYEAAKAAEAFDQSLQGVLSTVKKLDPFVSKGLLPSIAPPDELAIKDQEDAIRTLIAQREKDAAATKKQREEAERFAESLKKATEAARRVEDQGDYAYRILDTSKLKLDTSIVDDYKKFVAVQEKVADVEQQATYSTYGYAGSLGQLQSKLSGTAKEVPPLTVKIRGLGDALKSLKVGDFGQVFKDLAGYFKNGLKDISTGFLEGIGHLALGGLTSLLDKGLGVIGSGFKKAFDAINHTEGRKVNDLRDAFQASFGPGGVGGTLDDLVKGFGRVGLGIEKVQQLLHAGTEKQFKKIVDEFNAATSTQKTAFDKLNEAAAKYGFTIDELGPAFRAQKLAEEAGNLFQEYELLRAAGVDTATILRRMYGVVIETAEDGTQKVTDWGNSFGQLIHDAMTTGTALPSFLKPIVQQMIDLGQITKEDGTKYGSLEEAGLSFTDNFSDTIKNDLIPAIKELTETIRVGLGGSIDDASKKADDLSTKIGRINAVRNFFGAPDLTDEQATAAGLAHTGALVTASGLKHFHTGTAKVLPFVPRFHLGVNEVPAILKVGEAVLNERAVQNLGTDAIGAFNHGYTPQAMVDVSDLRKTGTDSGRGGDTYIINNTINGIDGPSIERVVRSRAFADAFTGQMKRQKYGINRKVKRSTP